MAKSATIIYLSINRSLPFTQKHTNEKRTALPVFAGRDGAFCTVLGGNAVLT